MRLLDERTEVVFVARDPGGASVEVQIVESGADGARVVRLTREEARRPAALILFQAARLDRPRVSLGHSYVNPERQSA